MIALLLVLTLTGGATAPQIVSHDVMYCASVNAYKFDIRIDGQWDFATLDGEGRRATGLTYLLGVENGTWVRRIDVTGTAYPFHAEIRMGSTLDGDLIAFSPIKSFDAQNGWLQFTLPTWAFGAMSRDLVYDVTVTEYGEGTPVTGWSYRSNSCVPIATESVTWGSVKARYE